MPKRQPKPALSDQSLLGRHPPRFSRLANRVVSLPELVEEAASEEKSFVQSRVASMPGAFPPLFPDDTDDEASLDAIPMQALSETAFSMQYDPRSLGFPQTPSLPAVLGHGPAMVAFSDDDTFFGKRAPQSQDWVTWASSPPKPIPALHGPLSLPYARCPSGAEGTLIAPDDRVSNVIWGLDNIQSRAQPQPEDSPFTEESPALSEFSPNLGPDPLFHAALRLAQQMEGLSMAQPGTPLLSPVESSLYLSGLGLDFHTKRHTETDGLGSGRRPSLPASHAHARGSRRVVSTGSLGPGDRLRPPPASSPLLTPPRPALPYWTPRLSSMLDSPCGFPVQVDSTARQLPYPSASDRVHRSSLPVPSLDRYPHAQDWQTRPNSNAPLTLQRDYSFGSDITIPGPCFDLNDYPSRGHTPQGHAGPVVSARETSVGRGPNQDTLRNGRRTCPTVDEARIPNRTLHRRLPVLEEDASFTASPGQAQASSIQFTGPPQRPDAASRVGSKDELYGLDPHSQSGGRSSTEPGARRGNAPPPRTVKTATYTAPHRRSKQKREA